MSPVDPLRQIKDLRGQPLARPATLPPKRRALAAAPAPEPVKGPPPTAPSSETADALTELGRQRTRDAAIREARAKRNAGTNADRAEAAYQQRVAERADQELAAAEAEIAAEAVAPVVVADTSGLRPMAATEHALRIGGDGLRRVTEQQLAEVQEEARYARLRVEFLEGELRKALDSADNAQKDATAALKRAEAADTRAGVARGEKLEAERLLDQARRGAEVARERYEKLSSELAAVRADHDRLLVVVARLNEAALENGRREYDLASRLDAMRAERDELLHHLASPPVHILPPASDERALVGTIGECRPVPVPAPASPWPADGAVVVSHLDQRTGEARVEVEFAAGFGFRVARSHNSLEDGSAPCAAVAFHGSTQGEPRGIVALDRVRLIAHRMLEAATLAEAMRDTPDDELAAFVLRGVAAAPVSAVAS